MIRWFKRIWEGFVEPASMGDARERQLSRILNIVLLVFLAWGIVHEIQSRVDSLPSQAGEMLTLVMVGFLALAYYLNRQGQLLAAILLTLGLCVASTFVSVLRPNVL